MTDPDDPSERGKVAQTDITARRLHRSAPIDVARALAVIGVVFSHTVDGMSTAGMLHATDPANVVNEALYIVRMPALVFLVGLFLPRGVAKRGTKNYLARRVVTLVYLYLLWQLLQGFVLFATNSVRNSESSVLDIFAIWQPLSVLWFLPFLAIATVIVVLLRPWRGTWLGPLAFVATVLVSVTTWGWSVSVLGLNGMGLLAFLAAGSVVGLDRAARWMSGALWKWAIAGVGASAAYVALQFAGLEPATRHGEAGLLAQALSTCAAAFGVVALLAMAVFLAKLPVVVGLLGSIGRSTMPIYLAHVIVVAGARIILTRLGFDETGILLALLIPLGVALPYLASRVTHRLRADWLFDLPRPIAAMVDRGRPERAPRHSARVPLDVSGPRSTKRAR